MHLLTNNICLLYMLLMDVELTCEVTVQLLTTMTKPTAIMMSTTAVVHPVGL